MNKYNNNKSKLDKDNAYYFINRMVEDITESDAYVDGTVDGTGTHTEKSDWSNTLLDKLVSTIQLEIGRDRCDDLFKNYKHLSAFSPLYIESMGSSFDYVSAYRGIQKLVSSVECIEYLPSDINRNDGHLNGRVDKLTIRKTFSVICLMIETLKTDEMPNSTEYVNSVAEAVESTFGVKLSTNYDEITKNLLTNRYIVNKKLTVDGINLLVSLCEIINTHKLAINENINNNHTRHIERISKVKR
jgi:hypothetical protein